jgi:futalosine hydrolase
MMLVITAVPAESTAVLAGLGEAELLAIGPYPAERVATRAGELAVLAGGVGPAAAAASAGTALAVCEAELVLSAGVAGGFAGRAAVGDVVVADRVVHADLGAESPEGYQPLDQLGLGAVNIELDPDRVATAAARVAATGQPVVVGPVITVSTVTGTAERAAELASRYRPAAEAMEGAGVLAAARAHGVPFLELRAISNPVGPRDRAAWDLPGALAALSRAAGGLFGDAW